MKSENTGRQAEEAVCRYLEQNGFKIIDHNWKTKQCEIDVVARKGGCIYFVEVKYRKNPFQGDGFEYITLKKQKQMAFAAEYWTAANKWEGEIVLSAASVSGPDFSVEFIEEF